MKENAEIDTGVEVSNARIATSGWQAEAYADNGEHATCWMLRRIDETTVESATIRCECGLRDSDGPVETYSVDAGTTIRVFGQELADADPELAIELAEEYWSSAET